MIQRIKDFLDYHNELRRRKYKLLLRLQALSHSHKPTEAYQEAVKALTRYHACPQITNAMHDLRRKYETEINSYDS